MDQFLYDNGLRHESVDSTFGELKEVVYLKRNNRSQESYNVKYVKEINRLKSLQKAEAYLEPKRASKMDLFCEYTYGSLFSQ